MNDYHRCENCDEILLSVVVQLERVIRADQLTGYSIAQRFASDASQALLRCDNCGEELGKVGGGGHRAVKRILLYNERMRNKIREAEE